MDYQQALHRLLRLTSAERLRTHPARRASQDLGRMEALLAELGAPHVRVPAIHVVGTKGKGSVAAVIHSTLVAAGSEVTGLDTRRLGKGRYEADLALRLTGRVPTAQLIAELAAVPDVDVSDATDSTE